MTVFMRSKPEEHVEHMRKLAHQLKTDTGVAGRLAQGFLMLDRYLMMGGLPPKEWTKWTFRPGGMHGIPNR